MRSAHTCAAGRRVRLGLAALCLLVAWRVPEAPGQSAPRAGGEGAAFSYDDYAAVLTRFVDEGGMVDYRGLKADSGELDAFLAELATIDTGVLEEWSEKEKIALWTNAYNALTLKAVINHYPIKASFGRSLAYPKNSIRQIQGVWEKLKWKVMGREVTLDGIEHAILRARFNEPRIHMALVCAAMGCPPLRNEPYAADKLDEQLDDQTKKFLGNSLKFQLDADKKQVRLSPIFKWFGGDFVKTFGTSEKFAGHGEAGRAVLNFVAGYLENSQRENLERGRFSIKYLDYDWELNERKK